MVGGNIPLHGGICCAVYNFGQLLRIFILLRTAKAPCNSGFGGRGAMLL
jgi:hypothetical protein